MAASPWQSAKFYLQVVPIAILVTAFIALVAYVSWSIHIFNPVPLRIHMDCAIYLGKGGKERLERYKHNRTVLTHQIGLNESKCSDIRKRRYLPTEVPDSMEVHHHMYFLRIVSKDYDFLEEVMTMMYSPLHFYCFVIDSSASAEFQQLVRILGECILNIIVPPGLYDTSTAHGTFAALNACYVGMEKFPWKHTIVTAENEMPIHSIHYIAENARRLAEAARIGRVTISEEHARILDGDFTVASDRDQEYLRRAVCTWLNGRRFPLTMPRSFQPALFKFLAVQDMEHCQVGFQIFNDQIAPRTFLLGVNALEWSSSYC
ncbi:unnamed protein product [Heligmosomoides polygyrus]|uniref:Core-2/I-branching beta-1,6-N-acetylglucosaminyltransferase family protein n=1 Tax=Heligmosomoides polygyrus TaxID=6339 RepID=A0A183GK04_HELPZ|nr:unnamed protein product [Heligmosomoides polygyrus]